jgi:hypothetical protein
LHELYFAEMHPEQNLANWKQAQACEFGLKRNRVKTSVLRIKTIGAA